MKPKHFLLVGNGPYTNRGCEAIVRGTAIILRDEFGADCRFTVASFGSTADIDEQRKHETDPLIEHVRLSNSVNRFTKRWWQLQLSKYLGLALWCGFEDLNGIVDSIDACIEVGGDNYTLDYGSPMLHVAIDRMMKKRNIPVIIWGASIGPFIPKSSSERLMIKHLNKLNGIFLREDESADYLASIGVDPHVVYRVADPAFSMPASDVPSCCSSCSDDTQYIGLNLSPLIAKWISGGDMGEWQRISIDLVRAMLEHYKLDIMMIPHVFSDGNSDYDFMLNIVNEVNCDRLHIVDTKLSASELKGVISGCRVFIGARTHATIAAFSTGVPTICLAYSNKAIGLTRMIYGCPYFCVCPSEFSVDAILERLDCIFHSEHNLRKMFLDNIDTWKQESRNAGHYLRTLLVS